MCVKFLKTAEAKLPALRLHFVLTAWLCACLAAPVHLTAQESTADNAAMSAGALSFDEGGGNAENGFLGSADYEEPEDSSISFGASSFVAWREQNPAYTGNVKNADNFNSLLGGALYMEGSRGFLASYYAKVLLSAPLSSNAKKTFEGYKVSFEKIYFKSRLADFAYLTVGKTELSMFRRFKNPVGLVAFDFLLNDTWSFMVLPYFLEVKNWSDVSFACGVAADFDHWALNAQLYWEKQHKWIGELQVQYIVDFFALTVSSTAQQKPDNVYAHSAAGGTEELRFSRFGKKDEFSGAVQIECGFNFTPLDFSFGYEFYSEGYTKKEIESIKRAAKNTQNKDILSSIGRHFAPHYVSTSLNMHDWLISNFSASVNVRFAPIHTAVLVSAQLNYAVNQNMSLSLEHEFKWSKADGEYNLLHPYRNTIQMSCIFYF